MWSPTQAARVTAVSGSSSLGHGVGHCFQLQRVEFRGAMEL
jgi:hypothetical protein